MPKLDLPQNEPVAVISDVHANLTALEAVLADIRRRGIRAIVALGDIAGKGPRPAEVVDRVRDLNVPSVLGNWDELLGRDEAGSAAIEWQRARLGAARLEWLRGLPSHFDVRRAGGLVRLVHASPRGVWHRVHWWSDAEELAGMFASTAFVGLDAAVPDAVGYADVHTAFAVHVRGPGSGGVRGRLLFNAGSVGNPLDQPVPSYAVLEAGPGLAVSLVRVPYDAALECEVAVRSGMPQLEEYLEETRFARYQPRS